LSGAAAAEPHFDPATVERLAALLAASEPSAGPTRVLAIDGRSGAGKSSLAVQVAALIEAPLVSLEYLYGGWGDLAGGIERLSESVLEPLSRGELATIPQFDWTADAWGASIELQPPADLIVEGFGSLAPSASDLIAVGIWLEAPEEVRRSRATSRDGGAFASFWDGWAAQEEEILALGHPAGSADVVLVSG
jgi:cytidylate kinase